MRIKDRMMTVKGMSKRRFRMLRIALVSMIRTMLNHSNNVFMETVILL